MKRETPAGYSRSLYRFVKAMHGELVADGYSQDVVMVMLMDVMMRLSDEHNTDGAMMAMIDQMKASRI